mgnify:CR=1 FL=1
MNLRRHKLFLIFLVIVALLGTSVAAGAATIRVNTGKTFTFKPDTGGNTGGGTQQPNLPPEKPVEEPQKPAEPPTGGGSSNSGSGSWSGSKNGNTWVFRPDPTPKPDPKPDPKPNPEPTPEQPPTSPVLTAKEQQLFNLVNQERLMRGLAPLQLDPQLVEIARLKSKDMIVHNYFAHTSPTYGTVANMLRSFGVFYKYAGENLAGAYSVSSAHSNLMASAGHRQNILNPLYTDVGIGIVEGGPYGMMITQLFVGR